MVTTGSTDYLLQDAKLETLSVPLLKEYPVVILPLLTPTTLILIVDPAFTKTAVFQGSIAPGRVTGPFAPWYIMELVLAKGSVEFT